MKKRMFGLSMVLFLAASMGACKKNVKISPNTKTTFTGDLSYTSTTGTIITVADNATATVSGNKGNYTITFSDNVPSISGIRFDKGGSKYVSASVKGSSAGIELNETELKLGVTTNSGDNYSFNGIK